MTLTHILVDFENTQPTAQEVALVKGEHLRLWIFRGPSQKKYEAEFAEALMSLGGRVQVVRCEKSGRNALDMHIAFQLGRLVGTAGGAAAPQFVVVSRDTDYEPVIQYMLREGFGARRVPNLKAAVDAGRGEKEAAPRAAKARAPAAPAGRASAAKEPKAAKKVAAKAPPAPAAKAAKTEKVEKKPAARAAGTASKAALLHAPKPDAEPAQVDKMIAELKNHPKSRPVRLAALRKWLAARTQGEDEAAAIIAAMQARGVVRASGTKLEYPAWG